MKARRSHLLRTADRVKEWAGNFSSSCRFFATTNLGSPGRRPVRKYARFWTERERWRLAENRDSSRFADVHVSLCQGEKNSPEARFGGARTANSGRTRSSHACLSAMVPAFAEPDIHSLSRILADRHRRLSVCSLPVLKQFEESLGSLISVAQSATAGPGNLRAV